MRSPARVFFVCVFVLGALFGGLACSVGQGSKISKSDVDKLNTINASVWSFESEIQRQSDQCSEMGNVLDETSTIPVATLNKREKKCEARLNAQFVDQMESAAAAYDEIADGASGKCQKALRAVERDIRGEVAVATLNGKQMEALDYSWSKPKRLEKDASAVPGACHLKVVKDDHS